MTAAVDEKNRVSGRLEAAERSGGTLGAALLIAGTSIGAGMLGMPLATGAAGFLPALLANVVCWALMFLTGLLFLEVTLWMADGANLLSMAERFLGAPGKWAAGIAFAFLYYCLLTAYIAGGVPAFGTILALFFGAVPSYGVSASLFTLIVGAILAAGTGVIDRVNWILMTGLILSYLMLVAVGSDEVTSSNVLYSNWWLMFGALPVLFTSYGFHNVIPSLSTYLARDEKRLRAAITIGSLMTLVIFCVWQWVVIGILGRDGLALALEAGAPVTQLLALETGGQWLPKLATFFGFFALVTSFLGVALSVVDFLGDGFGIKNRTGWNRVVLCCAVLVPPLLFAGSRPDLFYTLIGVAGGFGEAFLNGLLPVAMVWVGRYKLGLSSKWKVPGGRVTLLLLLVGTLFVSVLEGWHLAS